jgi:hypothetical protein
VLDALTYRGPALRVLHEGYAKNHRIDDLAPIHARREITVNAPARHVWQILRDVSRWADTLEPGVKGIQLNHGVQVEALFTRSNQGVRMRARFAVLDENHEIAWTGSDETTTRVLVEESMAGPLLGLYFSTAKLTALLEASLRTLKAAAEPP